MTKLALIAMLTFAPIVAFADHTPSSSEEAEIASEAYAMVNHEMHAAMSAESTGDVDADFIIGGLKRAGKTQTIRLKSGDVLVFGGPSRLRYHGVRKIVPETSPIRHPILPPGGRINLTLRRAA